MAVPDRSLEQFRDRVLNRRLKSEESLDAYILWIKRFEKWRANDGRTESPELHDIIDFDDMLYDEERTEYPWENARGRPAPDQYSYSSRNLAASALKLWLRLEYGTAIAEEPQNIVQSQPEAFDPNYLSKRDVERVIEEADRSCPCDGCEAALRLSYDAIMRASELVQVRREDINFDDGTVYVRATKGSQNSTLGLEDETLDALEDHIDSCQDRDRLFWHTYNRPWKPRAWARHFSRKHHEAGSHSWGRHTPIVHRLQDGASFGEVFRRARHSNPSMTARYAKVVDVEIPDWAES